MKWLISVAVAVAMVLGVVAMASPALALELPDPTLLEAPGVTLPSQFDRGNAPVFPSGDLQDMNPGGIQIDQGQSVVHATPGDVELPDFTLPEQCQRDNAQVFLSDEIQGPGGDEVDEGQEDIQNQDQQTV